MPPNPQSRSFLGILYLFCQALQHVFVADALAHDMTLLCNRNVRLKSLAGHFTCQDKPDIIPSGNKDLVNLTISVGHLFKNEPYSPDIFEIICKNIGFRQLTKIEDHITYSGSLCEAGTAARS